MSPAPPERLPASINVRVSIQLHQQLQDAADELGVSLSDFARLCLGHGQKAARDRIARAQREADRGTPIG